MDYLLRSMTLSTARGYVSALNERTIVGEVTSENFDTRDIFEIESISDVKIIYKSLLGHPENLMAHSRYTAAIGKYIQYLDFKNNG